MGHCARSWVAVAVSAALGSRGLEGRAGDAAAPSSADDPAAHRHGAGAAGLRSPWARRRACPGDAACPAPLRAGRGCASRRGGLGLPQARTGPHKPSHCTHRHHDAQRQIPTAEARFRTAATSSRPIWTECRFPSLWCSMLSRPTPSNVRRLTPPVPSPRSSSAQPGVCPLRRLRSVAVATPPSRSPSATTTTSATSAASPPCTVASTTVASLPPR